MGQQVIQKFACLLLIVAAFAFAGSGAALAQKRAPFKTQAEFAILLDAETNSVLFEKNADELMHPASMSKLMTLELVFKAMKEDRLSLDDEFTASEFAWRNGGAPSGTSAMFVPLNETTTLHELLQGITVQSGNDACIILAEGISGDEMTFAEAMTERARELGMRNSSFANSTGLPHPDHMMTARDLASLARHIIAEYPDYYPYFAQKEFKYRKHNFINRNPLIETYIGADGLKTGYIKASGYGIVASARHRDQRLIAVLNGLKSKRERTREARKLLDWGFRSFKQYTLFDDGETVGEAIVYGGSQFQLPLVGDGGVRILLPRAANRKKIKASIIYDGPLKAPIAKGDEVAKLRVTTDNNATTEVPLYASQDVEQAGVISRGFDSLLHLAFGWIL